MRRFAVVAVIASVVVVAPALAQVSVDGQFASVPSGDEGAYYGALGVTSCSDQANATNRISLRFDDRGDVQGDFEIRVQGSTTCDAFNRCEVLAAMTGTLEGAYQHADSRWEGTFEASGRVDVLEGCEGDEATIEILLAGVGAVPAGTEVPVTAPWSAALEGTVLKGRLNPQDGPGVSLAFEAPGDAVTVPTTSSTARATTTRPEEREPAKTASQPSDDGGGSGSALILVIAVVVVAGGLGAWWALARRRRQGSETAAS